MIKHLKMLLAAVAVLALADLPASGQEASSEVTNAGWLDALERLKDGEGERNQVVQGCVVDLYGQDDEWQVRQTIAGLLEVANPAAFKVFCRAFVHAYVSDRLAAADFNDLMDKSDVSRRSRAAGRVLREVYYAHQDLMRLRARGELKS